MQTANSTTADNTKMLAICQERGCKHEMYASIESLTGAGWYIDGIKRKCPCHHPTNPRPWPPLQEKTKPPETTSFPEIVQTAPELVKQVEAVMKVGILQENQKAPEEKIAEAVLTLCEKVIEKASEEPKKEELITQEEKKIKEPGKISSWFE